MCVKPNKGPNRNLDTSSFLFSSTSPLHPYPPFILVMQSGYIIFFTAICDLWVNEENVYIYIYIFTDRSDLTMAFFLPSTKCTQNFQSS